MPNALGNMVTHGLENNYTYDADGRRIANASTEFLYDLSGRAVSFFDTASQTWTDQEIYAGGRHLATYYTDATTSTTEFLHTDWLGTRRVMTSVSGANSETCTGLPFGDSLNCTGTDWDFNHFTDDIHDSESNTEHTWFRQLSSTQGRWMRPDPYLGSIDLANPQSLNRYSYVLNGPTLFTDPLGLWCVTTSTQTTCGDDLVIPTEFIDLMFRHPDPSSGGGGSGGSGGGASPAANSCAGPNPPVPCANAANNGNNCPTVPTHPGYANINANMAAAKATPFAIYTFYNQVHNHGPWDYKQAKNLDDFGRIIPQSPFEDFGNFNYGATAASLGLSVSVTLRAAGYAGTKAATGSTWDAIKAALGSPPYGDDSRDQQMIVNGYNFSKQGCHE